MTTTWGGTLTLYSAEPWADVGLPRRLVGYEECGRVVDHALLEAVLEEGIRPHESPQHEVALDEEGFRKVPVAVIRVDQVALRGDAVVAAEAGEAGRGQGLEKPHANRAGEHGDRLGKDDFVEGVVAVELVDVDPTGPEERARVGTGAVVLPDVDGVERVSAAGQHVDPVGGVRVEPGRGGEPGRHGFGFGEALDAGERP